MFKITYIYTFVILDINQLLKILSIQKIMNKLQLKIGSGQLKKNICTQLSDERDRSRY